MTAPASAATSVVNLASVLDAGQRQRLRDATGLDPVGALEYFDRFYAAPLAARLDVTQARILDCACGFGWLSAALALRGARQVVAADLDPSALAVARLVIGELGLADRVEVMSADVTRLPFPDRHFDAVCTIETIEHVPIAPAMTELARVCRRFLVIETINRRFPLDTHDTSLPLVHWLPTPLRAAVHRGVGATPQPNRYPTLEQIEGPLAGFTLRTHFKTFDDVEEWERAFPFAHPYQGGRVVALTDPKWRAKRAYFRAVFALLGHRGRAALDKIMGIYERT